MHAADEGGDADQRDGDDEPCHVWAGGVPWRVEEDDEGRQQRGDGCEHQTDAEARQGET